MNRVWSRPVRERPLRGPYDSPHSSDDDSTDQLDRRGQQRLDELDTTLSADDDDELNADDGDRFETRASDNTLAIFSCTFEEAKSHRKSSWS